YDVDFPLAFAKSQAAAFGGLPTSGTVFISVADRDKRSVVLPPARLVELGFRIIATAGTASVLRRNGISADVVRKGYEGRGSAGEPTVVDLIDAGEVDMVVNTPGRSEERRVGKEGRARWVADERQEERVDERQISSQLAEAQV